MSKNLTKPFLLVLVVLVLIACYFVYRPFLTEIFVAAILASVFYTPYKHFSRFLGGHNRLAAALMCLLLLVIVILPTVKLLAYAGDKSVDAYNATVAFFNTHDANDLLKMDFFNRGVLSYLNLSQYDLHNQTLQTTLLDLLKQSSDWLLTGATIALEGSANFVISLALIIIALFFFFVDGQGMLDRLMALSPLPDRYNQEIFRKFRAVSYSTFFSNLVAALARVQGLAVVPQDTVEVRPGDRLRVMEVDR